MGSSLQTGLGSRTVNRATLGDVPDVVRLRDAAATWLTDRGVVQWGPNELPAAWVEQLVRQHEVWLLRHNETVVGTVTVLWEDPIVWGLREEEAGYLHTLVVDRRFAGLGLGRDLLAWAEGTIVASHRDRVRLDCVRMNDRPRSYYEEVGYRLLGYRDFPDIDGAHETALYEKRLLPSGATDLRDGAQNAATDQRSYQPRMSPQDIQRIHDWHEAAYQADARDRDASVSYLDRTFRIPPQVHLIQGMAELLGRAVLSEVRPTDRVLDMGTGCGVNAVLAASKSTDVVAVDINPLAVACTKENAERNGVGDRIDVYESDVFQNVSGEFDLIIFDPPFR